MKALSVKQPWASLIACGFKTIECRTWKTKYRGPLLICASKGDFLLDDGVRLCGGYALAVVELVDVRRMKKDDFEAAYLPDDVDSSVFDGYAWVLRREMEIVPVPVKGKLNLFNVDVVLDEGWCSFWHRLPFRHGAAEYYSHAALRLFQPQKNLRAKWHKMNRNGRKWTVFAHKMAQNEHRLVAE